MGAMTRTLARTFGSAAEVDVATQAIPHVRPPVLTGTELPGTLVEHGGPSVLLEVTPGGFRIRHEDQAKKVKRREDKLRREAIELGTVAQSRGWLNDDMEFWGLDESDDSDSDSDDYKFGDGGKIGARSTEWSRAARARTRWSLAAFDYNPVFENDGQAVLVTLTMPGAMWEFFAPRPAAWVKMLELFQQRFADAWGSRPIAVWKTEFQGREAPHIHILMRLPEGRSAGEPHSASRTGKLRWVRHHEDYSELLGDGNLARRDRIGGELVSLNVGDLDFDQWLSLAWAKIVHRERLIVDRRRVDRFKLQALSPVDPAFARDNFNDHVVAGTGVDYPEERYRDPKRVAEYFSKHGAFAGKEYQNRMPSIWLDEIKAGASSFHFSGAWRLKKAVSEVELAQTPAYLRGSKISFEQDANPPNYVKRRPRWGFPAVSGWPSRRCPALL
ncbi:hypothetical protein ACFOYW_15380 [Gryllotalpicola reticulitermitis]|uniref:Uncharacterized protein n=1 Tax=Gryllotalpicola reticulitermitis TaxID=1184153 RepID=A0ABV8Q8T5_9MICO